MTDGPKIIRPAKGRTLQQRRARKDGWTPARREIFLDHLASCTNVGESARAAAMTGGSAFRLRRRDPEFADHWSDALAAGYARLESMLIERAAGGAFGETAAGGTPVPEPREMDTDLALNLLRHLKGGVIRGRARNVGPKPGKASAKELADAILAKLDILNKRLARARK